MYRFISLLSFISLYFNVFGYHTDYGYGNKDQSQNDDDDERTALMGLDYYEGFRENSQDYSDDRILLAGRPRSNIVVLDSQDARNYKAELLAGNKAELQGTNPNHYQPDTYPDFSRRFIPQYPYKEKIPNSMDAADPVPILAPPEMVIAIAKESAILNAAEPINPTNELIQKDILRTGNYWNAFWKEDGIPEILRQNNEKALKIPNNIIEKKIQNNIEAADPVPILAPPEMVIAIAKESALLNAAEPRNPINERIQKDILRTGNYWNAFWKEDPTNILRENNKKALDTMEVQIRPQSELFDLISKLKQISPTLMYVLNDTE